MNLDITLVTSTVSPLKKSFEYVVPVSLSHIFRRYLFIPGVKKTDEAQPWRMPGLVRTVYFEDGSTAREELLTVVPYDSFTYQITDFKGINKALVSHIQGAWHFSSTEGGGTDISWTYSLFPRNALARIMIRLFVAPALRGFLQRALTIIKCDLDDAQRR